jgi:hypothetical protein
MAIPATGAVLGKNVERASVQKNSGVVSELGRLTIR